TGSTFVRWGRKTCANTSQLVYSGVVGGSWWGHYGAAANPLCLTLAPQFDGTTADPKYRGYLYGAEYQNIPNHHDHDVPCSVCRAALSTTIMIPATRTCPTGWTTQYTGHLASAYTANKAAVEYTCLDKDPENASSGHLNQDGYLFYYTVTACGSLPCPPYTSNKVVLCVVCSK
ncbi:short-chain collagen C4-like, partial [Babylonia areolata]|uniref:short-chain collagen C4-like n=1 Tax=Babylonia areolata TaxID=304850 RepID=UPI003FD53D3F